MRKCENLKVSQALGLSQKVQNPLKDAKLSYFEILKQYGEMASFHSRNIWLPKETNNSYLALNGLVDSRADP